MSSHRRFENSHVYPPMDVGPEAYYEGGGTEQGGYGYSEQDEVFYMQGGTPVLRWGPVRAQASTAPPADVAAELMGYDLIDAQEAAQGYGYGITTDVSKASKSGGGLLTFLDYMVGGFEEEDYKASPTSGGIDTRTGKPMDPEAARSVIESIGKPDYNPYDDYDPNAPPKKPDVKKLVIVAGSLVGAFALWKFVVEPRLGKKAE